MTKVKSEKLPEFLIVLSRKLPKCSEFLQNYRGMQPPCHPLPYAYDCIQETEYQVRFPRGFIIRGQATSIYCMRQKENALLSQVRKICSCSKVNRVNGRFIVAGHK